MTMDGKLAIKSIVESLQLPQEEIRVNRDSCDTTI
jgi:hypothetical protein